MKIQRLLSTPVPLVTWAERYDLTLRIEQDLLGAYRAYFLGVWVRRRDHIDERRESIVGHGTTEQAAVADLAEQLTGLTVEIPGQTQHVLLPRILPPTEELP